MKQSIIIICSLHGQTVDLQIPADIRADMLIRILAKAFRLPATPACIRCANPLVMLTGSITAAEYGLHDGSILYL